MTNFESAEKWKGQAHRCWREMEEAFNEGDWNLTIRRAQEAVELFLKALLRCMNVEFPKTHHIGPILLEYLKKTGVKISSESEGKLLFISSELAKKRAPAFYEEESYTLEDAEQAIKDAHWVKENFLIYWRTLCE